LLALLLSSKVRSLQRMASLPATPSDYKQKALRESPEPMSPAASRHSKRALSTRRHGSAADASSVKRLASRPLLRFAGSAVATSPSFQCLFDGFLALVVPPSRRRDERQHAGLTYDRLQRRSRAADSANQTRPALHLFRNLSRIWYAGTSSGRLSGSSVTRSRSSSERTSIQRRERAQDIRGRSYWAVWAFGQSVCLLL
jgi:hypothetical protein